MLASASALACSSGAGGQTGDEYGGLLQELRGDAPRVAASGALPNSAGDDGWAFGWKFYREEAAPQQNAFFSPYSISVASSMLVAGAAGQTKSEIQAALEFSTEGTPFHQARNDVAQALERRNREGNSETNAQALHVSNDLWLDPGFRPGDEFLDVLSAYYGAGTFLAPLQDDPEASRQAINQKVADDTEQLIPELLPQDSLTDAVFVLTNALYFKASWELEFSPSTTMNQPFRAASGASPDVPMMRQQLNAGYVGTDAYQAIALPYFGRELELVAIMPAEGGFAGFVESLSAETVADIAASLRPTYVALGFPKFEIESTVPLKQRLQALGMLGAFTPSADFSLLGDVFISDAFHQAVIRLDEEGTEAAAATAYVGVPTSAPPPPIPVTFDHPFVFFIRDIETNALLFVGHYSSP